MRTKLELIAENPEEDDILQGMLQHGDLMRAVQAIIVNFRGPLKDDLTPAQIVDIWLKKFEVYHLFHK